MSAGLILGIIMGITIISIFAVYAIIFFVFRSKDSKSSQANEIENESLISKTTVENNENKQAEDTSFVSNSETNDKSNFLNGTITQPQNKERDDVLRKIAEYENTSGIIWIAIGVIQCLSLVGIICGIWNIIVGNQRLKYSKTLISKPDEICKTFEEQLNSLIIILIINIFLGAVIGVIGAFFDLFVRNYVIEKKDIISGNYVSNAKNKSGDYLENIKTLKELLDNGAITQEEFDIKKKELLGL